MYFSLPDTRRKNQMFIALISSCVMYKSNMKESEFTCHPKLMSLMPAFISVISVAMKSVSFFSFIVSVFCILIHCYFVWSV